MVLTKHSPLQVTVIPLVTRMIMMTMETTRVKGNRMMVWAKMKSIAIIIVAILLTNTHIPHLIVLKSTGVRITLPYQQQR